MLSDITLGQYFPGNSLIHRLDPRYKIISMILYIVAIFTASSYLSFAPQRLKARNFHCCLYGDSKHPLDNGRKTAF